LVKAIRAGRLKARETTDGWQILSDGDLAAGKGSAFVLTRRKDLDWVFSIQHERRVNPDNTIALDSRIYFLLVAGCSQEVSGGCRQAAGRPTFPADRVFCFAHLKTSVMPVVGGACTNRTRGRNQRSAVEKGEQKIMNHRRFVLTAGLILAAAIGSTAYAQTEITGYGGLAHSGGTHATFGGAVGFRVSDPIQLFGEANYIPLGSYNAFGISGSSKLVNFGGGLNYNFTTRSSQFAPYLVAAAGLGHSSASFSGYGSASDNSVYAGFGAGFRYKLGTSWGIRPEVRYQRYLQNGGSNLLLITGGIYYQFAR
jgi:hypothetical protein